MDQDVCLTTEQRVHQVRVEFVKREDFDSLGEGCSELCCFNQKAGCPVDTGDERCLLDNGHYRVMEVL